MFIPIHQLNLYNSKEKIEYSDRWEPINGGEEAYKLVLEKIRNGAGEDFLQRQYEYGKLSGFLDDMYDLKGIAFVKRKMYHPTNRIVYHLAKKEGEEVISLGS
ncbi:hypothetical protein [Halanaerobium salsuginis]|uniref:Uncharacterized protein n=1 Tax=Halanaerobium salsuginis TaxID=29563 RepID=A0A1I4MVE6_9FIRM|nr:hypothetical protein [Halanaerobium salsuginis]SFM07261.1 hypothetical protein SAMN02983006_02726 [Halanaerobium salsuginis]